MAALLDYLPTGLVALVLGYFTYRSTRAGQKASERIQEGANRVAETQQALDAQKSIADQYKSMSDLKDKMIDRLNARVEVLERMVHREIDESAFETEQAIETGQPPPNP